MKIGLFGFGTVGSGFYKILKESKNTDLIIEKIIIKNREKRRILPDYYFSTRAEEVLNNKEVEIIVELIDDAEQAFIILNKALEKGKTVITANKKMLATHLNELSKLLIKYPNKIWFEASVAGVIPVIQSIQNYIQNDEIYKFTGILNGTSNYILTQIEKESLSFEAALNIAKENGYAESNPALDIEAWDPAYKLIILNFLISNQIIDIKDVIRVGIEKIIPEHFEILDAISYKLKPLAYNLGNQLFVGPTIIKNDHPAASVNYQNNFILFEGKNIGKLFFSGLGAGELPTGFAVYNDLLKAINPPVNIDKSVNFIPKSEDLNYIIFSPNKLEESELIEVSKSRKVFVYRGTSKELISKYSNYSLYFINQNDIEEFIIEIQKINQISF